MDVTWNVKSCFVLGSAFAGFDLNIGMLFFRAGIDGFLELIILTSLSSMSSSKSEGREVGNGGRCNRVVVIVDFSFNVNSKLISGGGGLFHPSFRTL